MIKDIKDKDKNFWN